MGGPLAQLMALLQGHNPRPASVRSDYGLTGAMISPQRSPYERTMAPGETRGAGDLQDMLGEIILAAGSMAVPGIGGNGTRVQAPGGRIKDRGATSQINAEREMGRNRAVADDIRYGSTTGGQRKAPGPIVTYRQPGDMMAEKWRGEVTVLTPKGLPVKMNIWADTNGALYAQTPQVRSLGGYQDAPVLGDIQAMKQQALEAFRRGQ